MKATKARRFQWLGHLTLEILGAGDRADPDYVEVSDVCVNMALFPRASRGEAALKEVGPSLRTAIAEAEACVKQAND